uniref:Uncharacterized protein n=1 Tax=Arundo donax TaxID=35708 RepID=A0A0A9HIA3_ARUDO
MCCELLFDIVDVGLDRWKSRKLCGLKLQLTIDLCDCCREFGELLAQSINWRFCFAHRIVVGI